MNKSGFGKKIYFSLCCWKSLMYYIIVISSLIWSKEPIFLPLMAKVVGSSPAHSESFMWESFKLLASGFWIVLYIALDKLLGSIGYHTINLK